MKQLLNYNPSFTPGVGGTGTLDFSRLAGFDATRLYAVINLTRNTPIYIPGAPGLGPSLINGALITLSADTSTHSSGDLLNVYYETDASIQVTENNDAAERNGNLDKHTELLTLLLVEQKVTNILLKEGLNIKEELDRLRADVQSEEQR